MNRSIFIKFVFFQLHFLASSLLGLVDFPINVESAKRLRNYKCKFQE